MSQPSAERDDDTTIWSGGSPVHDRADNVCVIGAGAAGLTAIKNLREYGFGVDCFERDTDVGGAWNWRRPAARCTPAPT